MRKGPWTSAEDGTLIEYVNKHGEGNWNTVHKNTGLARCGKSCRLRWANHLRPNLKKGSFSQYEQNVIIYLHSKIGNKWARMASLLPGRTDNEIKNFWNTRMKRCMKAGLPLYPSPSQDKASAYHYISPTHSTPSSFSSLPSASHSHPPDLNINNHLSYSSAPNPLHNYTNPFQQLNFPNENSGESNGNLGLPLSLFSPYGSSSSSSTLPNHSSGGHLYGSLPLVHGLNTEISSSQTPPGSATPASSIANNDYYEVATLSPQPNSGLLEDLVVEAHALSRNEDSTTERELSNKRKSLATEEENIVTMESAMKNRKGTNTETQRDDSLFFPLSTGKKPSGEDPIGKDDDLFSLVNNFSSELPMAHWYGGERQSSELESQPDTSPGPTAQEFAWALGNCWDNMPGIC